MFSMRAKFAANKQPKAPEPAGFYTSNGTIIGPDGEVFVPIGANVGSIHSFDWNGYAVKDYQGIAQGHAAMAKAWGWSAIRLNFLAADVVSYSYSLRHGYPALLTQINDIVNEYTALDIVVMLDAHDNPEFVDGNGVNQHDNVVAQVTQFWHDVATQYKNNPYVWFNLINEPPYQNEEWLEIHHTYAQAVRATGAQNIIVVDAPGWGQDLGHIAAFFPNSKYAYDPTMAPALAAAYGNVVLSQHNYGAYDKYTTAAKLSTYIDTVQATGLPILFGEYGYTIDGSTTAGSYTANLNGANAVFDVAKSKNAGSFWWNATHGDGYSLKSTGLSFFADTTPNANLSPAGQRLWDITHP